jgi:hypothetical protein
MNIPTIYPILIQEILNFYHSATFLVIKYIIGIYVLVVFVDLVLMLVQRGIGGNVRQILYGMNLPPEITTKKIKMKARWNKIRKKLESGNEADYKVAIIEADSAINDLIRRMGYKGENMLERIKDIPAGQLDKLDEIKEAHEIRNRIIHEEKFKVNRKDAEEVLGKYEHFLRHFEVLD